MQHVTVLYMQNIALLQSLKSSRIFWENPEPKSNLLDRKFIKYFKIHAFSIHCFSVTQLCPTLCHLMDCSLPGFLVFHDLLEFTPIHVHWVGDAIQPSHLLSPPSPPALSLPLLQGFFSDSTLCISWLKYCAG